MLVDSLGLRRNFGRDPLRERHDATGVATRWCVLLSNLSKLLGRETFGESNKGGPKSSMNQRDLSVDEPTHENLVRVSHRSKDSVDVMTLWMRPPAALDVFADDSFRKARCGSFGGSEYDAVLSDESQCLLSSDARCHDAQRTELTGAERTARERRRRGVRVEREVRRHLLYFPGRGKRNTNCRRSLAWTNFNARETEFEWPRIEREAIDCPNMTQRELGLRIDLNCRALNCGAAVYCDVLLERGRLAHANDRYAEKGRDDGGTIS